jgi:hypothetical protein
MYLTILRIMVMQELMESVVKAQSDELQAHLEKCGVVRSMFLPAWIMTVFSADFHPSVTGRLVDVMLVEGWRPPLKAVATALILVAEDWMLKAHKMEVVVDIIKVQFVHRWTSCGFGARTETEHSCKPAGATSSIAAHNSTLNSHMGARAVQSNRIG